MNSRKLNRQDCLDIIVTAIEGGIGYWSKVDPLERDAELNYLRTRLYIPEDERAESWPLEEGFDFKTDDWGGQLNWVSVGVITTATVRKGMKVIESHDPHLGYVRELASAADTGDIDSGLADCIIQAGMLGDVIYG